MPGVVIRYGATASASVADHAVIKMSRCNSFHSRGSSQNLLVCMHTRDDICNDVTPLCTATRYLANTLTKSRYV